MRIGTVARASLFALAFCSLFLISGVSFGQTTITPTPRTKWSAEWISHPTAPLREPGVFHFRKVVTLASKPPHFSVNVSADNRFILFVNGRRVGEGPARGDLSRWRYETFDLAPFLQEGENVIAATVWQYGIYAPLAQASDRLAFLLEGETPAEAVVNTDSSWKVEQEAGHSPRRPMPEGMWQYWAAGPGESIDGRLYDWGWKQGRSNPRSHWVAASPAIRESIYPRGSTPVSRLEDTGLRWLLVPDPLPPMEYRQISSGRTVRADNNALLQFPANAVVIPARSSATLLLDEAEVISAYPELVVSGGKGARVEMAFTEALYDAKQERGNRNEIENRTAIGLTDEIVTDGGSSRVFAPLWWRTWRYLELKIRTEEEPLTLNALRVYYTAYPFKEKGTFKASDPELGRIREICWRTARLDAHETYMDTAFWEQLQYIGDTRLQSLISYAVSGDDRLARQALQSFDDSRVPEGITQSRYPASLVQFIPPFSLLYVNMLHDFWMYRPDQQFVKELLPGTRPVLAWFLARQRKDGMLSSLPGWTFVDSPKGIDKFPRSDSEGRSSVMTLQFIGALKAAAELEDVMGDQALAQRYRQQAQAASEAVYKLCWDPKLGLIADTPARDSYSQHANITAVLFDAIPKRDQEAVMNKVLAVSLGKGNESTFKMAPVSLFYQFYLSRALEHSGMSDSYVDLLAPWREMLAKGLTTTPEYPDPSRSDTHAWSAHPAFDLTTMVAGIRPGSPGFSTVRIEPGLGKLEWVEASYPHVQGTISCTYHRRAGYTEAVVTLPGSLTGTLEWKGKSYTLHPGEQKLQLPN